MSIILIIAHGFYIIYFNVYTNVNLQKHRQWMIGIVKCKLYEFGFLICNFKTILVNLQNRKLR